MSTTTKPSTAKPSPSKPSAAKPSTTTTAQPIVKEVSVKLPAKPKANAKTATQPAKTIAKPRATTPVKSLLAAKTPIKNKVEKPKKIKMKRDSFTMPKDEYAKIDLLKAKLNHLGKPAKKSELLRAGIMLLAAMNEATLTKTLAKVPVIKTGRPKNK